MTLCPHCKSENNNFYYCKGCGRKFVIAEKKSEKKEGTSTDFISEVIDIIEKKSNPSSFYETVRSNTMEISLEEMSKDEGILLIDGEQWTEISSKRRNSCFLGEIFFIYILSAMVSMTAYIAGANEIAMIFQTYASAFLLFSFVAWFLVPYFSGFSPIASVIYHCSMFNLKNKSVKNMASNLFSMFIFSAIPYIFVLPFLYSALRSKFSENYLPLSFSSSEINYLEKVQSKQ